MTLTIEPTDILHSGWPPFRIWKGTTERGTPVIACIAFLGAPRDGDQVAINREFEEAGLLEIPHQDPQAAKHEFEAKIAAFWKGTEEN